MIPVEPIVPASLILGSEVSAIARTFMCFVVHVAIRLSREEIQGRIYLFAHQRTGSLSNSMTIAASDRSRRSLQGQPLSMPPIRATTKDGNIL